MDLSYTCRLEEQHGSGTRPALLPNRAAHLLARGAVGWLSGRAVALSTSLVSAHEIVLMAFTLSCERRRSGWLMWGIESTTCVLRQRSLSLQCLCANWKYFLVYPSPQEPQLWRGWCSFPPALFCTGSFSGLFLCSSHQHKARQGCVSGVLWWGYPQVLKVPCDSFYCMWSCNKIMLQCAETSMIFWTRNAVLTHDQCCTK